MKIDVYREACCSQDDQLGPLDQAYEVPDDCRLGDLVTTIAQSRFLQYTSSHAEMSCRIAGQEVATVFSPYDEPVQAPRFAVSPDSLVRDLAVDRMEFVFDPNRPKRPQPPKGP
jgi:hypothetical protein